MDISQIKVVVSDMDGALLDDSKNVLESSILAIKKIKEKGLLFGLCTGRDANNMANVLIDKWKIKEYVDFIIGCGGAQFYNLKTNECKKN
ncbi:HAD family hydrolase [Malacoplasma penetrans]|uniref:HAD family hydrolase n=1 Tax=Malacoplasma penetrans TaxID=28227 RepID=UPI0022771A22|nr:HAD hydrolase family protein [Malacoplasma penetrans]